MAGCRSEDPRARDPAAARVGRRSAEPQGIGCCCVARILRRARPGRGVRVLDGLPLAASDGTNRSRARAVDTAGLGPDRNAERIIGEVRIAQR